ASQYDQPILVGQDTTFVQAGSYSSIGLTAWAGLHGKSVELKISGSFQQYLSDDLRIENQMLDLSGQRAWTRVSFYYKNYIYERAAFMKAGFYVQVSPTSYRSSQYYPAMDYWDPNSWSPGTDVTVAQALPEFIRLDLDMTTRIRSVIFLFRLENALDNWLMPGYFETAYQPMPSRRFRFGIRWVLRN
ncbi:MAG: putative porin, partial [Balneolales bacterium]